MGRYGIKDLIKQLNVLQYSTLNCENIKRLANSNTLVCQGSLTKICNNILIYCVEFLMEAHV